LSQPILALSRGVGLVFSWSSKHGSPSAFHRSTYREM
jgi:hypothetical protein